MRFKLSMGLLFAAAAILPSFASANDFGDCNSKNPVKILNGCTAVIETGKESAENVAIAYLIRGLEQKKRSNPVKALQDLDMGIALYPKIVDPRIAAAHYIRGGVYFSQRKYKEAIDDYSQSILLNPKNTEANRMRGISYRYSYLDAELPNLRNASSELADSNLLQLAIKDFNVFLQKFPNNAEVLTERGTAYFQALNNYTVESAKPALDDFSKAISINPKYMNAYSERSSLYGAIGENTKSEQDQKMVKTLEGQ